MFGVACWRCCWCPCCGVGCAWSKRSASGYARILDSVADAVLVTDEEGKLEYFNERAQSLLGFNEGLLGRPLESIATFRAGREQPVFDPLASMLRGR